MEKTKNVAEQNISKPGSFNDRVHRLGVTTTLIIWVFFLAVPFGISVYFDLDINIIQTFTVGAPLAIALAITGLAEKLSITPVIGPGAMYLASATGNVQNMKLPAALNAMRLLDVEPGSEKGRIVSIIAVATSAFVTTAILFAGMLFLAPLITPLLTHPVVEPAFNNILPALLGPMVMPIIMKAGKVSLVPFLFALIFVFILGDLYGTLQSLVMAAVILMTLGVAKIFYNKKNKTAKE